MNAFIIALMLYAEAGGEPVEGIHAVASVLHNRAVERGEDYGQVLARRRHWSGLSKKRRREAWDEARFTAPGRAKWKICMEIARTMLAGTFVPSIDANHFYNPRLATPPWGHLLANVQYIGNHKFGKL